jgi:hypothetical protein
MYRMSMAIHRQRILHSQNQNIPLRHHNCKKKVVMLAVILFSIYIFTAVGCIPL